MKKPGQEGFRCSDSMQMGTESRSNLSYEEKTTQGNAIGNQKKGSESRKGEAVRKGRGSVS